MATVNKNHNGVNNAKWILWPRRQNIYRSGQELYMIRWEIFRCPWFSLKLHKFILSDDACLHDHPWSFISLILWGGYYEWRPLEETVNPKANRAFKLNDEDDWINLKRDPKGELLYRKWHGPLSILYRKIPARHSVEMGKKPALTLVLCFPKVRSWGFYTAKGWTPWREYDQDTMRCE